MIKENNYISIKEVISRVTRHPLLQEVTTEQVVQYTLDFITIFGLPELYADKEVVLHVEEYRCLLPCDLISINQIKDNKTSKCLRSMTDTFMSASNSMGLTFKTQGQVLYTSFKTGDIAVSYKAILIDKDGFPLIIDNPLFLKTLELYIKKEVFTIFFDMGKISGNILQNTQQQYAWSAGQLQSEFSIPSISEMESLKNAWCTLIQRTEEFSNGFKSLGNKEHYKIH